MKYYVIVILGILATGRLNAQDHENATESTYHPIDPAAVSKKNGYDTEPITVKRFDQKRWKEVVGTENYTDVPRTKKPKQITRDSANRETSGGEMRFTPQDHDEADDSDLYESTPINSALLKMIIYVLSFGIIGFILFAIFKNISLKTNGKVPTSELPDLSAPVADIRELEIDRLLREALTHGNYRLAIRIYFLGLLKKLDENGAIVWKKDKTNRDYLSELFSKVNYFEEVRGLTLAYEKVWYGDHSLPKQSYENIILSFKAIDEKINTSKGR